MNIDAYLHRIGIGEKEINLNIGNLKTLQRQHLLNVPFENLDIHWGNTINLDVDKFYSKIVENGRGGFCYELNGLFNELLKGIGFKTKIVSARVANKEGVHGLEYDHLAILVEVNSLEYLVDVGFGDFISEPLKIDFDIEQSDPNGIYIIRRFENDYLEVVKKSDQSINSEYIFKYIVRDLNEFAEMCVHNQTSPDSHFTKGKICSSMTENGRKSLSDRKYIVTTNGIKQETEITSEDEFNEILRREFGISNKAFPSDG